MSLGFSSGSDPDHILSKHAGRTLVPKKGGGSQGAIAISKLLLQMRI